MKDLSVIIVNYRSWDKLAQCLDSLSCISEQYFTFEVIVVDNASADGKFYEFRQLYPGFNFIQNQGNFGFANGNNLGVSNSRGKYLLFLNPDTVVTEKAISAMLGQARVSCLNSIISCRQIRKNGSEDKPFGVFPDPMVLTGWTRALSKVLDIRREVAEDSRFKFPDWVSGSVVMMSKLSFYTIGGWDERFWLYYEDVDICLRARELGGEIYLLKNVAVIHNHGGSSRNDSEIAALTKTEVNISLHEYLSLHNQGLKEFLMHVFLIFNHLVPGLITAIPGLILFFNKRLFILTRVYFKMVSYYFNVLVSGTWISPRSLKSPGLLTAEEMPQQQLITLGEDHSRRA